MSSPAPQPALHHHLLDHFKQKWNQAWLARNIDTERFDWLTPALNDPVSDWAQSGWVVEAGEALSGPDQKTGSLIDSIQKAWQCDRKFARRWIEHCTHPSQLAIWKLQWGSLSHAERKQWLSHWLDDLNVMALSVEWSHLQKRLESSPPIVRLGSIPI